MVLLRGRDVWNIRWPRSSGFGLHKGCGVRGILAVAAAALMLSSCGSKKQSTEVVCASQFWNGTFATCLPKDWKVLSSDALKMLGVPEETIAAFQTVTARSGQFDTVTATREPLAQTLVGKDYSEANVAAVSALPEYKLLDKQTVYVDGSETVIHIFTARPASDSPIRRYYQLSAVAERNGYTFTGSFPVSVDQAEADSVMLILKNVSFVDPTKKAAKSE